MHHTCSSDIQYTHSNCCTLGVVVHFIGYLLSLTCYQTVRYNYTDQNHTFTLHT